jgi:hypothetical protein
LPVWIPDDIAGNCCATVWHSKGYDDGNRYMANKIVESVWRWSDQGRLPVVCDASSCSFGITSEVLHYLTLENLEKHKRLTLLDSVAWAYDYLLPRLKVIKRVRSAVVHPVCATHHLGLSGKIHALVASLAEEAVTPIYATCCAFAGDRGMLHPELTKSATSEQVKEIGERHFDAAAARGTLARGLALAGKDADAAREFRAAIPILMAAQRENADDDDETVSAARSQRLQAIVEAYIGLLAKSADGAGGQASLEAFALADAIRGRSVQKALSASSARIAAIKAKQLPTGDVSAAVVRQLRRENVPRSELIVDPRFLSSQ